MQIQDVLFARTKGAILALYFLNPAQKLHLREVVRRLGTGHSTVQKEVQQLWKSGLLTRHREGKRIEYQANPESLVFHQLRALLERTAGPVGELHRALRLIRSDIDVAFIYGSVAADTASVSSDLDLMVIGRVSFEKVVKLVRPAQDRLGREINPSVYPRLEFSRKIKDGDPFLQNIVTGAKKFVIGDSLELENLV